MKRDLSDKQVKRRREALRMIGTIPLLSLAASSSVLAQGTTSDSLSQRIGRLEDLEDIRTLRNMYHYFLNERVIARLPEIYTADAIFEMDNEIKWVGVKEIIAGLNEVFERVKFLKQFIHSHQVSLNGDSATGFSYLDARYALEDKSLRVAARYDENYIRTLEGWRISRTFVSLIYALPLDVGWAADNLNYFSDGRP